MRVVAPLSLVIVIAIAGCGGGSSKSTTQVETHREVQPLTKAAFISLGDVICRNHDSRTKDLESQTIELGHLDSNAKARQVAGLLRQQADNLAAEARELQGLESPPADVGRVGSILGRVRANVDLLREWARAYEGHDAAQIRALQLRIAEATTSLRSAARAYGFEVCGQE